MDWGYTWIVDDIPLKALHHYTLSLTPVGTGKNIAWETKKTKYISGMVCTRTAWLSVRAVYLLCPELLCPDLPHPNILCPDLLYSILIYPIPIYVYSSDLLYSVLIYSILPHPNILCPDLPHTLSLHTQSSPILSQSVLN